MDSQLATAEHLCYKAYAPHDTDSIHGSRVMSDSSQAGADTIAWLIGWVPGAPADAVVMLLIVVTSGGLVSLIVEPTLKLCSRQMSDPGRAFQN